MSKPLADALQTLFERTPSLNSGARLCVALSGGLDSVVLLHLLSIQREKQQFQLSALHVHHGLSPNADRWTAFCEAICLKLNVPLIVERVDVARESGEGIEAAARKARYAAFGRCGAEFLVLAHHRDDQAETVLLNLLRGAGVHGAAAMPESRALFPGGPILLRPLLALSRSELESWARQEGLEWIEDESNADPAYSRNFLRHQILPALKQRFPGSDGALARAAGHFTEGAELLDDLAALDLTGVGQGEGLSIPALSALSPARARNLLRHWMRIQDLLVPDTDTLNEALRQLLSAREEASVAVNLGSGYSLRRYRAVAQLVWQPPMPEAVVWNGESELPWSGGRLIFHRTKGQGIAASHFQPGRTFIRLRQPGDRLRIHPKRPTRTLKNLLQENAVPDWIRTIIPCIELDRKLLWVGMLGIDVSAQAGSDETGVDVEWRPACEVCRES